MCLGALRGEHSLKVARSARAVQGFPLGTNQSRLVLFFGPASLSPTGTAEAASRTSAKVSLARYRMASRQVMAVLARYSKRIEKASIDEVYMDITAEVSQASVDDLDEEGRRAVELTKLADGSDAAVCACA